MKDFIDKLTAVVQRNLESTMRPCFYKNPPMPQGYGNALVVGYGDTPLFIPTPHEPSNVQLTITPLGDCGNVWHSPICTIGNGFLVLVHIDQGRAEVSYTYD